MCWSYAVPVRRRSAAAAKSDPLDRSFRVPLTDKQLERIHEAARARGLDATPMARELLSRFADYVLSRDSQPIGVSDAETEAYLVRALGDDRK